MTYSIGEAVRYINEHTDEKVQAQAHRDAIAVVWGAENRPELFTHLIENGWIVTSVDGWSDTTHVWLDKRDNIDTEAV